MDTVPWNDQATLMVFEAAGDGPPNGHVSLVGSLNACVEAAARNPVATSRIRWMNIFLNDGSRAYDARDIAMLARDPARPPL